MGDWEDEDAWDADAALGALDSKLGAGNQKASWDDEDEVEVAVPEVAKPAQGTLAAKAKAIAQQEIKLSNQVKYALQDEENAEDKKARIRREIEDADHALTEELLGSSTVKTEKKLSGSSVAVGLAAINLNTVSDHKTFGLTIAKKIQDSTPMTVVAFFKSLLDNLPPGMTTESLDQILAVVTQKRAEKKEKEGEQAKANKGATKTKKQKAAEDKRHKDVFGGVDSLDPYYEKYGAIEDGK